MACKLPGADNLDEYWKLLIEGRSAVVDLPPDRLNEELYYDSRVGILGKTYSKLGALIPSREFQRSKCPIPPELERSVDPAHLLMCEVAGYALQNAGLDPFNVPDPVRNCAVYIGHAQGSTLGGDYTYATCIEEAAGFLRDSESFQQLSPADQQAVIQELVDDVRGRMPKDDVERPDVSASMVAGAITKAFKLSGPFAAINSACASSLQSILLGARALQMGHVDMAIVGGASDCKSDSLVLFSHARAVSATGSRPFDSDADGLVCGEGYAAIVLKTLSRALEDGDRIHAVVRGLGVSSDGKGKSLWAPRKEGQIEAMKRAYRSGVDLSRLQYLEAHSTATQLGDATELNTLTEILSQHFPPGKKIPVTSVKANIGHSLETAGIASMIKAILCIQNKTVAPAINIRQLNSKIDWNTAPVYVPTAPEPWPAQEDGSPRLAGVNAFGIGGLNMHVVVEEFTEASRALVTPAAPTVSSNMEEDAVAVIGMGCVWPGAKNINEYWELLRTCQDPKSPAPADRLRHDLLPQGTNGKKFTSPPLGGFVHGFEYDWRRHKVPPKQIAQADPLQFMLLDAADQALIDAGYNEKPFDRSRVSVLVGTEFGGDFAFQLQVGLRIPDMLQVIERSLAARQIAPEQAKQIGAQFSKILLERWPALIDETGSFSTSSLASRIGKTWNLMGGAAALDAGEASSLLAINISMDMLLAGDCDMMICAAGQRRMGLPEYELLAKGGVLSNGKGSYSPLDARGIGFVPGEGVGVVLLKRLSDARRDGDHVRAIIRGIGSAHQESWQHAVHLAMERAFQQGNARPEEVTVIELDALTRETVDEQLEAISAVQSGQQRTSPVTIGSVSSQIGFSHGAAGMASLHKAVLEMEHGELPPTLGAEVPAELAARLPNMLRIATERLQLTRSPENGKPHASVVSCGRGIASYLVCEPGQQVASPVQQAMTPIEQTNGALVKADPPVATGQQADRLPELASFLVNFVVEQTGYPPEVVELDADLEADLGIDSIKKAQLFGELQEYFDVTPTDDLTLDDFPTLRHVLDFLANNASGQAPTQPTAAVAPSPAPVVTTTATAAPATASPPAVQAAQTPASQQTKSSSVSSDQLEAFLINFVVEQTGYPADVVELDADLEADLGIDSIKKAQLFGELQEYFDVTPSDDLTLDDFPTLRHVVDYLASSGTDTSAANSAAPATGPEAVAAVAAPVVEPFAPQLPTPSQAVPPAAVTSQTGNPWRIVRFGAESLEDLLNQIPAARANCANHYSSGLQSFAPKHSVRLAIVVDGLTALESKLQLLDSQRQNVASWTAFQRQGIFFCESIEVKRPQIAFFFPGQGSQYDGMLRDLVESNPVAEAAMQEADTALLQLGSPTFAQMAWTSPSQLGTDAWATQASLMVADHIMNSVLVAEGLKPDLAAGHSYGEYCALVATGAWSLAQALQVTRARCAGIEACKSAQGGLLATSATPEQANEYFAGLNSEVYVATHNAPTQTVVGGGVVALQELSQRLADAGYQSRVLEVPCPFHTPLMADSCGPLRESLRVADIRQPNITTFSLVTNREITGPDEIRANLEAHMTRPQPYVDLVRLISDERPTVFVEVGPQQHLTRLNEQILDTRQSRFIASDNSKGSALEQVCRVRALLDCCGALDRPVPPAPVAGQGRTAQEIVHFDATQRRKERLRNTASGTAKPIPVSSRLPQQDDSTDLSQALLWDPSAGNSNGHVEPAVTPVTRAEVVQHPAELFVGASNVSPQETSIAPQETTSPTALLQDPAPVVEESSGADPKELEAFLVNFVVEQTGYPPEIVELDADLEADLGIDSIKKAQLFGELQEYFDVTPTDDLTLDDFPTLRHVVDYLAANTATESAAPVETLPEPIPVEVPEVQAAPAAAVPITTAPVAVAPVATAPAPSTSQITVSDSTANVRSIRLTGTAHEMGISHGQEFRQEIRRALQRLADLGHGEGHEIAMLLGLVGSSEQIFSAEQLAELQGIAAAVEVPVKNLIALNLWLLADLGSDSAQFAIELYENGRAVRHGLCDEVRIRSALSECLIPLVQIRQPSTGTASVAVTFAGCVGALAGLNANGLAVSSGMIHGVAETRATSNGQRHPLLTRQLLEQAGDVPAALQMLREAPASMPWNMVLSSANQKPCLVEYDGQSVEAKEDATVAAANHGTLAAAESNAPEASKDRLNRLQQYLSGSFHSIAELQTALAGDGPDSDHQLCVLIDHSSGDLAIYSGPLSEVAENSFSHFAVPGGQPVADAAPAASDTQTAKPTAHDFTPLPYDLDGDQDLVTKRYVMRLVDVTWPVGAPETPTFNGPALIVGENLSADALADRLRSHGVEVHRLSLDGPHEAACDQLEQLCSQEPVTHLFFMQCRDEQPIDYFDDATWQRVYHSRVLAPLFLCQRWVQLANAGKWLNKCTIVAATNSHGDFGFAGDVLAPETGAFAGLLKALYLELNVMSGNSSFLAKAIDSPQDEPPETLAQFIFRELAARTPDYEVSYVRGVRYLQVAIGREADVQQLPLQPPQGNWVLTGGARGITAECARELGKRFGVKLHLIGTSPLPQIDPQWRDLDEAGLADLRAKTIVQARESNAKPNEAWDKISRQIEIDKTLRSLAADGLEAHYYTCDVADRDALSRMLDEIRAQHGPIEGILHGAGIERSCRIEKKQPADIHATLGSKVLGAWNLMRLTKDDPIRHFLGFGSVSGRVGSNGQLDYCVASDMLCKLVSWYGNQRKSCHAVAFHWHPWDEVGMANRPETRSALQHTQGIKLMPKRDGLSHLIRELYAGQADSELLITEPAYHGRFYPDYTDIIAEKFRTKKKPEFPARIPDDIASRFVMRMAPAPLDATMTSQIVLTGGAYILGNNEDAQALRDHLQDKGVAVQLIPEEEDCEKSIAHLESAWQNQPARALFLMTGRDPEAAQFDQGDMIEKRMSRGVYLPFQVTQRWFQLVSDMPFDEPAALVAATALGGDFGFSGGVASPEGGALCGLLKSVYVEDSRHDHTRFKVKLIDSPSDETPQALAEAISAELASGTPEVEVSWAAGARQTVTCFPAPTDQLPQREIPRGGTWVITGGGRGITAYAAFFLARRYGLKIHMIGKSPAPDESAPWLRCSEEELKGYKASVVREAIAAGHSPEEAWGKIRKGREIAMVIDKYKEGGVEPTYHGCDITDEAALAAVLDKIRSIDGPIEGIMHGAGFAKAARFESRVGNRLQQTFGPKADGTVSLMRLTKNDPLRYFLAFGSLSGRYGGNGLSDYASANDMLAKLCGWFRTQRPECATTCFHWQTWDRIGMAMVADAVDITKSSFKMEFMEPEEGFEHLHREVLVGVPEAEVLIADDYFEKSFYTYPVMQSEAEASASSAPQAAVSEPKSGRPLIDSLDVAANSSSAVAAIRFDSERDPFLVQHRLKDKPFLPGVVGLEAVVEAAAAMQPDKKIVEVRDVEIVNGLMFRTADPIATRIELSQAGNSVESQLLSELRKRDGQIVDPNRLHVKAAIEFGAEAAPLEVGTPGKPPLGWHPYVYPEDGLIYHGPALRCLKQCALQYDGGWGLIVAPSLAELAGTRSSAGWILPSALLDACVVACGSFAYLQFGGQVEVPHGFERIRWSRQPRAGEKCVARFYFRGRQGRHSLFDIFLFGDDQQPIMQIKGYRTVRVGGDGA